MCSPICRRMRDSSRRRPPAGGAGSGRYGLSMCSGGSSTAPDCHEGQHVLLAHAPAAAGARHLGEVDAVLGRDALDDRGVAARRCGGRRG